MINCSKILDMVYENSAYSDGAFESGRTSTHLLNQVQIWLHTIICPNCAQEIERFEASRIILREDFFPASPDLEDSIMTRIAIEDIYARPADSIPGGFSTRGWVIAGLIIFISFAAAFFGLDFQKLAHESGMSFMLPMGITIGIVVTSYGALFIGSHLKELSERFGL